MESGLVLLESTFLRRGSLGFRRRATRSNLTAGTWCIGVLLLFLGHIAILLLCWLDAFVQQRVEQSRYRKARKSVTFDGLSLIRSGILRFVELEQRRVESRRTAVGLAPLGRTSSGW